MKQTYRSNITNYDQGQSYKLTRPSTPNIARTKYTPLPIVTLGIENA